MSKRAPDISVLTGSRLQDGIVVYLAADGRWVEAMTGAVVARSADAAQALQAQGARDAANNVVVEPYLAEVREVDGRILPVRVRERLRVEGPSVLADVTGYVAPSPRATPASPRTPSARAEGRGEEQRHTPTPASMAAPHPSPLPASGERGSAFEAA
jgi:hypothetical protein